MFFIGYKLGFLFCPVKKFQPYLLFVLKEIGFKSKEICEH